MTPTAVAALANSILDTHHELLKRELPLLAAGLRGADPAVRIPFAKLKLVLAEHLLKEEQILFPMILSLAAGEGAGGCGVQGPIAQMNAEHDVIRQLEAELRENRPLAGTLAPDLLALLDDLAEHAAKEDELLFPAAIALAEAAAAEARPRVVEEDDDAPAAPAAPASLGPRRKFVSPNAPPIPTRPAAALKLQHLGWSGLLLELDGHTLAVDPPEPVRAPVVLTWTERERVSGARGSTGPIAAAPEVLTWLSLAGPPLVDGRSVDLDGFTISARPYTPIPYATAPEAARKARSALLAPARAVERLAFTLRRPQSAPLALRIDRDGTRVVLLGQALHRFLAGDALAALAAWAGHADLVVAGTDYDDEVSTGEMLAAFDARVRVVADLTGEIRRSLRLPVRPLSIATAVAPAGTRRLGPRDGLGI